jgi:hypothetical protein
VLISCLGHYAPRVRSEAVKQLNALYDMTDWQLSGPFNPVVRCVGDAFDVDVSVRVGGGLSETDTIAVIVAAPPRFESRLSANAAARVDVIRTLHLPRLDAVPGSPHCFRVRLTLASFSRCGFYDWRVVAVGPDGSPRALEFMNKAAESAAVAPSPVAPSPSPRPPSTPTNSPLAQGRFIIQRESLSTETWHETVVDLEVRRARPPSRACSRTPLTSPKPTPRPPVSTQSLAGHGPLPVDRRDRAARDLR